MAKRITSERVKKWGIGVGAVGVPLAVLLFWFMANLGSIDITGYSGDVVCEGTIEDPCLAYINFTVKEDIFIYPSEEWGSTPFYTDVQPKSVKMYRSWGTSWREIKLNETCKGTWCGAGIYDAKYSFAFREGRSYQIKFEVLKNSPDESIKWGFGPVDPIFYGREDNQIIYKEDERDVQIVDALYEDVLDLSLVSHQSIYETLNIIRGKDRHTMIYYFDSDMIIKDGIGEVIFINLNNEREEQKDYYFEYKEYYNVTVQEYSTICKITETYNGSIEDCSDYKSGQHQEERFRWKLYNSTDIPDYPIEIALTTDVDDGDYYDAKWNIAGVYIEKHATWTESYNVGLQVVWRFNNDSADGTEAIDNYSGTYNFSGLNSGRWLDNIIINGAYNSSEAVHSSANFIQLNVAEEFTISSWFRSYAVGGEVLFSNENGTAKGGISCASGAGVAISCYRNGDGGNPLGASAPMGTGAAKGHVVIRANLTHVSLFVNGTLVDMEAEDGWVGSAQNFTFWGDKNLNQDAIGVYQDETVIWNRSLSTAEINAIWTDTLSYVPTTPPVPSVDFQIALSSGVVRFGNCSPDFENKDSQPQGQNSTLAVFNATNDGTTTADFTINVSGALNTGWIMKVSNDSLVNNLTLSTTAQTIWSDVTVNETKNIWLTANCSFVSANPGVSIDMQAV